jgi:hypothetical protein
MPTRCTTDLGPATPQRRRTARLRSHGAPTYCRAAEIPLYPCQWRGHGLQSTRLSSRCFIHILTGSASPDLKYIYR